MVYFFLRCLMLPKMEDYNFIKSSSTYGVQISFYYDRDINTAYAISANGISCELKNFKDIYFYKDDVCVLHTIARTAYVNSNYATIDAIVNYLEYPILFHVSPNIADKIFELLKDKKDISFTLHPKEMLYFFSYVDDDNVQKELGLLKYEDEVYFATTDFIERHRDLFKFISKYSLCVFEFYDSLESHKKLYILHLEWTDIFITYDKDIQLLSRKGLHRNKYKNFEKAIEELVIDETLKLNASDMLDYIYRYFYAISSKKLKPRRYEYEIDFTAHYKDVLKLVEMIDI